VQRWCRHALEPLQELPGCQNRAATLRRVWGQRLQSQWQELADHAVAVEQRFGCLAVLRWSSQFANGRDCLFDPCAWPTPEDLPAHGVPGLLFNVFAFVVTLWVLTAGVLVWRAPDRATAVLREARSAI
jgi:hypothetical protein